MPRAHNELPDVTSLHFIAQPSRYDSRICCIRPGCGQPVLVPISFIFCTAVLEGAKLSFAMAVFFVYTSGCQHVHGGGSLSRKTLGKD